jgi:hypothetical protein
MEHTKNRKVVLMNKKEDTKLNDCYEDLFKKVVDLQLKYSSQMIAGTMMAQALKIYKSTLDDEGFKGMMETISESEHNIQPYNKPTLQ